MERVVARENMRTALKRVRQNKGGPGVDGMTVEDAPSARMQGHENMAL